MAWYQRELNAHTLNAQRHYAGLHTKSHAGHDFKRSLVGQEAWSGREKAAFFAALSRHSRWRPELISADCGKSEHAVRAYIEQLERGQRAVRRRPTDDEDSREVVEVSQAFVEREEGLASELLALSQPNPPRINQGWSWKSDLKGQLSALQCAINADESAAAPASVPTIDEDDLAIQALEAIPKLKRSKKEKAQLRHLLNRKRNRTAYRRKMLRSEGWTDERIAEGGGADAVFELEQANKAREKRPGARRKTPAEVAVERADAAAKHMRDCGAVRAVKEKGLDVFDYNTLALFTGERRAEGVHVPNGVPADGGRKEEGKEAEEGGEGEEEVGEADDEQEDELDSRSDTKSPPTSQAAVPKVEQTDDGVLSPSVTLPVMQHLYAEMLAYLKPLIYQAIVIAEAQNRQLRSEKPELTASHVLAALRLRDELDYATDSAPSSPASSEPSLPSTEAKNPTKPPSPGALSPNARAELQLPTWADFPPPLPPSTPDRSPLAQYTPLTPLSPETPSRPRWAVDNTPQPEFTFLSPDTTTSGPSVVDLPSFPISHPEPNYLDEGTDEEDVAIEAALRRYHKSADRAWDRMYAHGLRNAAKADPFATPSLSQSQSRRSSPGPPSCPPSGPPSRAASRAEKAEEDRKQRKKLKRALEKIDRASERAETDWARYSSVRDTLLRRRERRRAQLRRLREGERRKKRRKLRPPEDELDDGEEGEIHLPAEERRVVTDEIVGTTDEEDAEADAAEDAEDAAEDAEDGAEEVSEEVSEDGAEDAAEDAPVEEEDPEGSEDPEDAEDGALDEDEDENEQHDEKEERLMDVSFESGDGKEDDDGLGDDVADSDGALDEDLPEADGALDEDDSF